MTDFATQIVLGLIQGIFEWLPFSSEGVLFLYISNFIGPIEIDILIRQILFLHLGTFFAALIYFRKEVLHLTRSAFNYKIHDNETRKTLKFLLVSTLVTGIVGLAVLQFLDLANIKALPRTSTSVNLIIGFFLLITGFIQVKASRGGFRREVHLNNNDSLFLGFMQGIAALPGLSRSGLTISAFLFRNMDETVALRLSFIMSLPVVLMGNILLNFADFAFMKEMFFGFLVAFLFGFLTIHVLMKFSEKVKFGHFVIFFAVLMILASLVGIIF